jgi:hypothetical protein
VNKARPCASAAASRSPLFSRDHPISVSGRHRLADQRSPRRHRRPLVEENSPRIGARREDSDRGQAFFPLAIQATVNMSRALTSAATPVSRLLS